MDLGRAFNYVTKDENWLVKLLIGAVLSIVTLGIIPLGYQVRIIRDVLRGDDEKMPEWDDWGGDLVRGIMVLVAYFVYSIPLLIVVCCLSLVGGVSEDLAGVLWCFSLPVFFIYGLGLALIGIPAMVNYAATDNFTDAFFNFGARFREATVHISDLIMLVVLIIIVQFVGNLVGGTLIWLCGLGLLAYYAGNIVMTGHLIGQFGQKIGMGTPAKRGGDLF